MNKILEALNYIVFNCNYYGNLDKHSEIVSKSIEVLKIIVRKAHIRFGEMNGQYYFSTTNNYYFISKEKYDLLKQVLTFKG